MRGIGESTFQAHGPVQTAVRGVYLIFISRSTAYEETKMPHHRPENRWAHPKLRIQTGAGPTMATLDHFMPPNYIMSVKVLTPSYHIVKKKIRFVSCCNVLSGT